MATRLYLTLHCSVQAQLQLLYRKVAGLRCSSAASRTKNCYFYHQSFNFSTSAHDSDNGTREYVQDKHTGMATSNVINSRSISDSDNHDVQNNNINLLNAPPESHNLATQINDFRVTKHNSFKHLSTILKKNKNKTVSQYFEQSWLNYYDTIAKKAGNTERNNQLQTKPMLKRRAIVTDKDKPGNLFGTFSMEIKNECHKSDQRDPNERLEELMPEDIDERRDPRLDIPLTRYGRKGKDSFYYTKKIVKFGRQGKIKEAITVFEHWMLVQDRVMPTKRTFVALIGILGRAGYTEKAFELFGKMKQFGVDPVDHIYTGLFNACANSPSCADGLYRAEYLLNHMKEKAINPNLFTVKAAMKSLAICGDFSRVFTLLDDASMRLRLDIECYGHLLMACISDKEAGFWRALQVWQQMGHHRVRPNTSTFNLLIRSARDCGIGNLRTFASSLGLHSLDAGMGRNSCLLESFNHSLVEELRERNNLPFRQHELLTAGSIQSDLKLEVLGVKMKIYNSVTKDQQDLSICADDVSSSVVEHGTAYNSTSLDLVNEKEASANTCVNETTSSRSRAAHTTEDNCDFTCRDLPDITNNSKVVSELQVKTSFISTNSDLVTSSFSLQAKRAYIQKSQYSDILTEDSHSISEESKSSYISLKDLKEPSGRLALLGGASSLISYMETVGAQPDVKTFTQILACLPNDEQSEFELLIEMEKRNIKPDIDFLNDIMMRRNFRKKSETVKVILKIISKLRLTPNMRTYAALAHTCRKEKEAFELLQEMKEANLEPNSVIMGTLIYASQVNFIYKLKMLKAMESFDLKATQKIIATIEKSIAVTKERIIEAEERKDTTSFYLSESFQKSFQYFLRYYKMWLMQTELDRPSHPQNL